jgi:hypothetical protein
MTRPTCPQHSFRGGLLRAAYFLALAAVGLAFGLGTGDLRGFAMAAAFSAVGWFAIEQARQYRIIVSGSDIVVWAPSWKRSAKANPLRVSAADGIAQWVGYRRVLWVRPRGFDVVRVADGARVSVVLNVFPPWQRRGIEQAVSGCLGRIYPKDERDPKPGDWDR